MKCIECGNEWKTQDSSLIDRCPFCGAKLHNMDTLGDALKWILNEKGVSVFNNGSLINSMLADLAKDKEKERNKIRLALSSGAGSLFYKLYIRNNGAFHDTEIKEFQTSLEEFGFADDFSVFVLTTFLYAVGLTMKNTDEQTNLRDNSGESLTQQLNNSTNIKTRIINDSESNTKFMMNIENTFTITGRGTVITGTVLIGTFSSGDVADVILDNGNAISTTITGIEMFRKLLRYAQMGDSVGVLLRGVKKDDIIGAKALVNQGAKVFHKYFAAEIHLLNKTEGGRHTPIFNHYRPYFKFATTATRGIMTFTKKIEMLMPGSDTTISAELDDNIIIAPGMSFVIHEGDNRTVAKGKILDVF